MSENAVGEACASGTRGADQKDADVLEPAQLLRVGLEETPSTMLR